MRLPAFGRVYGLGKQTSGINADAMTPCPRWVARTGTSSSAAKEESRAARKRHVLLGKNLELPEKSALNFEHALQKKRLLLTKFKYDGTT